MRSERSLTLFASISGCRENACARQSVVVVQYETGRVGLCECALWSDDQTVMNPLPAIFTDVSASQVQQFGHWRVALMILAFGAVPRLRMQEAHEV